MAGPTSFFSEGNQPNPSDEPGYLLLKVACILYDAFGAGLVAPAADDGPLDSFSKIALYLYQGSLAPGGATGGVSAGGGSTDSYRFLNGQLQLWNVDQQTWQTVSLAGVVGQERLTIGAAS